MQLGKQQEMVQVLGPLPSIWDPDGVQGSWIGPGTAPEVVAIWGTNQHMETRSPPTPCNSAFQINKQMFNLKK